MNSRIVKVLLAVLTMAAGLIGTGGQVLAQDVNIAPLQVAVPEGVTVTLLEEPPAIDTQDLVAGTLLSWKIRVVNESAEAQFARAGVSVTVDFVRMFEDGVIFDSSESVRVRIEGTELDLTNSSILLQPGQAAQFTATSLILMNTDPGRLTPTYAPFVREGFRFNF